MKALGDVVLLKVDAEKGPGPELAKAHSVQGYPTFVLMNADKEPLDRWTGYEKNFFLGMQSAALADPTTIEQKRERFASAPSVKDAETLARVASSSGMYKKAVKLYAKAGDLGSETNHAFDIFDATAMGYREEQFSVEQVEEAAQAVLASGTPENKVDTYFVMRNVERKSKQEALSTRYLEPALASVPEGEEHDRRRRSLQIEHALRIEGDKDKAYGLRLAGMPEGWKDDHSQLNGVAWWCFENRVNLADALVLAERGVELAPAGSERAMILDTQAEICNAMGNCPEAVTLSRLAIENDPDNEFYQKQLVRFEELLSLTN